jgi:hypothetical protein
MDVREPLWRLTGLCPVCEQGSCLVLLSCPLCSRLVVFCEEEAAVFLDPRNLAKTSAVCSQRCPSCGETLLEQFVPATSAQIQALGLLPGDYE